MRQAKETVGQRAHPGRSDARPGPRSRRLGLGPLEATKARITASQAQVQAAEIALNGVREEARVGQRTTLDVLNAQQELLNARVNLITAQRDRVVASYALSRTPRSPLLRPLRPGGDAVQAHGPLRAGPQQPRWSRSAHTPTAADVRAGVQRSADKRL